MKEKKIERKKQKVMFRLSPGDTSIVCGTNNPGALGAKMYVLESGEIACVFSAKRIHEGHMCLMHGGLISAIIDEAMGRSNYDYDADGNVIYPCFTANLNIDFTRPIEIGKTYYAFGRIDKSEGRKNYNSCEIIDEEGNVYASGSGLFVRAAGTLEKSAAVSVEDRGILELCQDDPKEL